MTHVHCRSIAFAHALTYSILETTHNWVSHIPADSPCLTKLVFPYAWGND